MTTAVSGRIPGALCAALMALCLGGCAAEHFAAGLLPIDPPLRSLGAHQVDSLQPTLRWEAFVLGGATDISYELAMWRQEFHWRWVGTGLRWDQPRVVSGLRVPEYRMEEPLDPDTTYRWSVRAHFVLDGEPRVSSWSGWHHAGLPRMPGRSNPHMFKTPRR